MQEAELEINLKNISYNANALKSASKAKYFCAVLKADAYSHGAERVASFLEDKVDCFAVSLISEGVALRVAGISKEILVLTPLADRNDAVRAYFYGLTVTIGSERELEFIKGLNLRAHIKINTGMNRYGFPYKNLPASSFNGVCVTGVYSHFYSTEVKNCDIQLERFKIAAEMLEGSLNKWLVKHIAATGGLLLDDRYHLDMVRIGLGLYGYTPQSGSLLLKKAMKCYARCLNGGDTIGGGFGYGEAGSFKSFSAVRFGYGDGLNKNCKIGANGLCMDAFVTDKIYKRGERALVFDDAEEAEAQLKLSKYNILCSFSGRAVRKYTYE